MRTHNQYGVLITLINCLLLTHLTPGTSFTAAGRQEFSPEAGHPRRGRYDDDVDKCQHVNIELMPSDAGFCSALDTAYVICTQAGR